MRNGKYFSAWLDRTLIEREIAGGEVARALGVNDSAVSRWRNGKATPGLDSVMKLASFLDVHPVRLAVTAELMKPHEVGMEPLPMPKDTKTRTLVHEQILGMRGLTRDEKTALIETYDRVKEDIKA